MTGRWNLQGKYLTQRTCRKITHYAHAWERKRERKWREGLHPSGCNSQDWTRPKPETKTQFGFSRGGRNTTFRATACLLECVLAENRQEERSPDRNVRTPEQHCRGWFNIAPNACPCLLWHMNKWGETNVCFRNVSLNIKCSKFAKITMCNGVTYNNTC